MDKLIESYIVTLKDLGGDHLKAVANDGTHGTANCQFPKEWRGISRYDKSNAGRQFEVVNLTWTGKFYRVALTDIIKEIKDFGGRSTGVGVDTKVTGYAPAEEISDKKPNKFIVDLDFFESLNALNEDFDQYEVYDENDELLNIFDNEAEAITWAMENNAEYIDFSANDTADFERIWTRDDNMLQCDWCGEYFEESDLHNTDTGHLCDQCIAAIKSHGEPITMYENFDDDISEILF